VDEATREAEELGDDEALPKVDEATREAEELGDDEEERPIKYKESVDVGDELDEKVDEDEKVEEQVAVDIVKVVDKLGNTIKVDDLIYDVSEDDAAGNWIDKVVGRRSVDDNADETPGGRKCNRFKVGRIEIMR
jgi:hypothetical protein